MAKGEKYGYGGNLAEAIRTVTKSGCIRFDGNTFKHDFLKAYSQEKVFVQFDGDSPFSVGPLIIKEIISRRFICRIENFK